MKELYRSIGVTGLQTTPYHPERDGLVERFNTTLKSMLKKTLKVWNGQWDLALPHVLGEYRRAPHESTGFTPSELLYGRQIRGPLQNLKEQWTAKEGVPTDIVMYITTVQDRFEELQKVSRDREEEQKAKYKHQFDRKARTRSFQPGDLVLLRTPPKGQSLHAELDGPYSVMRRCDETTYELHMPDHPRRKVKRHINLLRPFNSPALGCLNATEILEREMPTALKRRKEKLYLILKQRTWSREKE